MDQLQIVQQKVIYFVFYFHYFIFINFYQQFVNKMYNLLHLFQGVSEKIKDTNTELITNTYNNRMEISKIILSFIMSNVDINELRNLLHSEVS